MRLLQETKAKLVMMNKDVGFGSTWKSRAIKMKGRRRRNVDMKSVRVSHSNGHCVWSTLHGLID